MVEHKYRPGMSECLVAFNVNCDDMKILSSIAENIKVKICQTKNKDELVKTPSFCLIIDFTGLDSDTTKCIISSLASHAFVENIIIINSLPEQFQEANLPQLTLIENIRDNQKNFKLNLLNMKTSALEKENKLKDHDYDRRIYRLLTILKLLKIRGSIDLSELTFEFGVTVRTLQRDIKILRQIGERIEYDNQRKVYYLPSGKSILLG